jgi:hypothetical protein
MEENSQPTDPKFETETSEVRGIKSHRKEECCLLGCVPYSLVDLFTDVSEENLVSIFTIKEQTARLEQKVYIETGEEGRPAIETMKTVVRRGDRLASSRQRKKKVLITDLRFTHFSRFRVGLFVKK